MRTYEDTPFGRITREDVTIASGEILWDNIQLPPTSYTPGTLRHARELLVYVLQSQGADTFRVTPQSPHTYQIPLPSSMDVVINYVHSDPVRFPPELFTWVDGELCVGGEDLNPENPGGAENDPRPSNVYTLQPNQSVWDLVIASGFTPEELRDNREILTAVALMNNITNFRNVDEGRSITVPDRTAMDAHIDYIRSVTPDNLYVGPSPNGKHHGAAAMELCLQGLL